MADRTGSSQTQGSRRATTFPRLRRTTGSDRKIRGVAGGIARWLDVDPAPVRLAFVLLTVANGFGLVLYLVAAVLLPGAATVAPSGRRPGSTRASEQALGVGLVTVGLLLLARQTGAVLPDQVVWPVALVAASAAVGWSRLDGRGTDLLDGGRSVVIRVVVGALLLAAGIGIFVALNERLVVATQIVVAVLVSTGGVVLLAGPWIVRLGRQLADERAERVRADERAEVAAHLHDSVLQTLALIQRRADSPTDTIALARRQERELRSWLFETDRRRIASAGEPGGDTVAEALRALADEVESDHAITVEVVVVGDAPLDDAGAALVGATREAVVNAAKHSGAPSVSVYGELGEDELAAFVRDRGVGFDPGAVPDDRRGLADSVVGRLARHGGSADVTASPGAGTEVALSIPIRTRTS